MRANTPVPPFTEPPLIRPPWWRAAARHLGAVNPVFKEVIRASRGVSWRVPSDPFTALARAILGQQISVAAANGIWQRLVNGLEEAPRPELILSTSIVELRQHGVSWRKAETLHALAQVFVEEAWAPEDFANWADEEIIERLTAIRGIGRWTVEMVLIFTLHRPNVLPVGDLGFRQAIELLYPKRRAWTRSDYLHCAAPWEPYGSAATWCLWQVLKYPQDRIEIFQAQLKKEAKR